MYFTYYLFIYIDIDIFAFFLMIIQLLIAKFFVHFASEMKFSRSAYLSLRYPIVFDTLFYETKISYNIVSNRAVYKETILFVK